MRCLHCGIESPLDEWEDLNLTFNDSGIIHGFVDFEAIDAGLKEPPSVVNSERGYACPKCDRGQPNFRQQ